MKKCELCKKVARMYCDSDQASLCWDCDSRVHTANFLVAKHVRTLLCHACQSPTPWTGSGPKLAPTMSLCQGCVSRTGDGPNTRGDGDFRNGNSTEDDEDGEDEEDGDDDEENGDRIRHDDDDSENQVVPLSLQPPSMASCSSSSSEESSGRRSHGFSSSRFRLLQQQQLKVIMTSKGRIRGTLQEISDHGHGDNGIVGSPGRQGM